MINRILLLFFTYCLAVSASFAQTTVEPNLILIGRDSLPKNGEMISDRLFFVDVEKGALRGGELLLSDTWSPDTIGESSFSWGNNTAAFGISSTALGYLTTACGDYGAFASGFVSTASGSNGATAMGVNAIAEGNNGAIALGRSTLALGDEGAIALGNGTLASGDKGATAMGHATQATGNSCVVIGTCNDTIVASKTPIGPESPLFIVGNGGSAAPSNALVIQKKGFVGVGDNDPEALLHISSPMVGDTTGIQLSTNNGGINSLLYNDVFGNLQIHKKIYPNQLVVSNHGNIGVGVAPTSGTNKLEVFGGANCDGSTWNDASDRRLKHDFSNLSYGLDEVMALHPVSYRMKSNNKSDIGFVAQEVKEIIPEVVHGVEGDVEKGETLSMSYGHLVAVLTKGMQEQQAQIKNQQEKIEKLTTINSDLIQRLGAVEALLHQGLTVSSED